MRLKFPLLWLQSDPSALGFDRGGQLARRSDIPAQADPHDPYQPTPFESADISQLEVKPFQALLRQLRDESVERLLLDVTKKADGQVEIRGRHPTKVSGGCSTPLDVAGEHFALRLGHRQPKKRPNFQRVRLVQ